MALPGRSDRRRVSGLYGELQLPAHRMGLAPRVRRPAGAKETPGRGFVTNLFKVRFPVRGTAISGGRFREGPAISPPGLSGNGSSR